MAKKWIAAGLLIALTAIAIFQAVDKKEETGVKSEAIVDGLKPGVKAPDFELKTLKGDTIKLSSLKGKKVMLNFWATWCGPCKAEMPAMQQLSTEVGDDVVILAVNIDPQLDVQGFVDENGITFPIPLDVDDKVNALYQIIAIPTTYFIDSNGIIQDVFKGAMPHDAMVQYVNDLK
ncbi:TlpA family protein disulfide reductase [Neobacillus notoginsengisoli]|uniref:TlpA family protein disulfide reductase n=1 Tax=Neobacillus notoginsengisoli TaxID=1578198 RepID=A0A417YXM4_9BACI|nr:redoxin domain-containing protein [Neobacillus notoginsengisoli]RHW42142.1 TlpA family protein disulfide reductase [Neobacillus notoginsengisoli]